MIDEIMKEHDVVPAPITLDLLKAAIKTRKGPYIIDGFPRSLDNLHAFDDQVYGGHRGFGCALAIFYFMADAEIAVKRTLEKNQTQKKGIQDLEKSRLARDRRRAPLFQCRVHRHLQGLR